MRTLYWLWSWLMFAAIVIQIGFAGYGAFYSAGKFEDEGTMIDEDTFGNGFAAHIVLGYLLVLLGLIFLLIGVVAGVGRWRLGRHGLLFLLLILQVLLAWFGFEQPVDRVPAPRECDGARRVVGVDRMGRVAAAKDPPRGCCRAGGDVAPSGLLGEVARDRRRRGTACSRLRRRGASSAPPLRAAGCGSGPSRSRGCPRERRRRSSPR